MRNLAECFNFRHGDVERIDHSLRELFSAGAAEGTPIVVEASTDSSELLLCRLTAPLATTATWSRIDRDRSPKFIKECGHKSLLGGADQV